MTTNGAYADNSGNTAPASDPLDISAFMNGPMPVPSAIERQGAINAATFDPTPPTQQMPTPTQAQPAPAMPDQPPVPNGLQPTPEEPQVQPPEQDDTAQRLAALEAQLQERESAYAQQQQEIEQQRQTAMLAQIQAGARQYALQQYQKYLGAGNTDEQARQWANNDAATVYQAYTYQMQAQQVQQHQTEIARKYGISPQDIPSDIPPQAMERFAAMQSQINRTSRQVQATSQNQVQQQRFDSNVGGSVTNNDPVQQLVKSLGDPTKAADPQAMAAWNQFMRQSNPYL